MYRGSLLKGRGRSIECIFGEMRYMTTCLLECPKVVLVVVFGVVQPVVRPDEFACHIVF